MIVSKIEDDDESSSTTVQFMNVSNLSGTIKSYRAHACVVALTRLSRSLVWSTKQSELSVQFECSSIINTLEHTTTWRCFCVRPQCVVHKQRWRADRSLLIVAERCILVSGQPTYQRQYDIVCVRSRASHPRREDYTIRLETRNFNEKDNLQYIKCHTCVYG